MDDNKQSPPVDNKPAISLEERVSALEARLGVAPVPQEFPKMLYHTDFAPREVKNADEQQLLLDTGWSEDHAPAVTGAYPKAAHK